MLKKIKDVSNENAVAFLKDHQAGKEQVAYGKADLWVGCYVRAHWFSLSFNKLVGVVGKSATKNTYRIKGLYVTKPYRRRHLAYALVEEILSRNAINPKRTTLYATVRSRDLFKQFGFVIKHENKYKISFMERPKLLRR